MGLKEEYIELKFQILQYVDFHPGYPENKSIH